jgi:nitrogen fixation protein FixH
MKAKSITGKHVLIGIMAFFAVVIGVDATFITLAVSSHPGEQVKNSYVVGLDYNREVERREAQAARGWTAQAGLTTDNVFVVRLGGATGAPVTGLEVSARIHVAGQGDDSKVLHLFERAPGEYAAQTDMAGPAKIEAEISAGYASGPDLFEAHKTLVLS